MLQQADGIYDDLWIKAGKGNKYNDAIRKYDYASDSLEGAALSFIRDWCEELRFDKNKATSMNIDEIGLEDTNLKKIKFLRPVKPGIFGKGIG